MKLLRAEIWWGWHIMLCALSYYTAVIPGFDWVLMVIFLIGSFAYVSWIKSNVHDRGTLFACLLLSQVPILCVLTGAMLFLCGIFYTDAQVIILQLSASIFYPLALLSPEMYLNDYQLYLWALMFCTLLHSLLFIVVPSSNFRANNPNDSYVEDANNMKTLMDRS